GLERDSQEPARAGSAGQLLAVSPQPSPSGRTSFSMIFPCGGRLPKCLVGVAGPSVRLCAGAQALMPCHPPCLPTACGAGGTLARPATGRRGFSSTHLVRLLCDG